MRGGGGDCSTFSRHLAQVQGTITWPRRRTEEAGVPLNIDSLIKARKAAQLHANNVPLDPDPGLSDMDPRPDPVFCLKNMHNVYKFTLRSGSIYFDNILVPSFIR